MRYTGWGGFWCGAAREQPETPPPPEETTCVLGRPKGQRTVAEDET